MHQLNSLDMVVTAVQGQLYSVCGRLSQLFGRQVMEGGQFASQLSWATQAEGCAGGEEVEGGVEWREEEGSEERSNTRG